jgi:ribosome biogenesis GTPase A
MLRSADGFKWTTQRLLRRARQLEQQRSMLIPPSLQLPIVAMSKTPRLSSPLRNNYALSTSCSPIHYCYQKNCQSAMIKVPTLPVKMEDVHRYFHTTPSSFAPLDSNQTKKKKRSGKLQASGRAGRIVLQQSTGGKSSKSKMCIGCGTEVTFDGGRGGNDNKEQRMLTGVEAVDGRSKSQVKKSRYFDPTDTKTAGVNFLCDRCKALKSNNFWKAYDALRDVPAQVFMEQLKHIVGRRRFGFCLAVVDATDPEHSAIRNLRQVIGSTPCMLVLNKIDLLPRMTERDRKYLHRRVEKASTRFVLGCHAVSARTGAGLIDLAEQILVNLGGRDVFVVGSANVGKSSLVMRLSTLIADSVYLKGTSKQATKRRQVTHGLAVTGSHLPGTTLQAIRVPCFSSRGHALWDTPGIINNRALQYHVFPTHLMEPLTRPGVIPVPTRENGLAFHLRGTGKSILIEATWMDVAGLEDNEADSDGPDNSNSDDQTATIVHENSEGEDHMTGVLARIDIRETSPGGVSVAAYLHPSLRVRIVPTATAPDRATIPTKYIEHIKEKICRATRRQATGLMNEYSLPLKPFASKDRPEGAFVPGEAEWGSDKYSMDICFASLGWVSFLDKEVYTVVPHCVEGSVFSKRHGLYPINLHSVLKNDDEQESDADEGWVEDSDFGYDEETKRRLKDAANRGRRHTHRGGGHDNNSDDEWFQNEVY